MVSKKEKPNKTKIPLNNQNSVSILQQKEGTKAMGKFNIETISDQPLYPVAEAARYIRLNPNTLRYWLKVLELKTPHPKFLSFNNLIEAYVIKALQQEHNIRLNAVKQAIQYASKKLNIPRILLHRELKFTGGDLFIEFYGDLINLSRSGQLGIKGVLEQYLERIDWENNLPIRLYPYIMDIQKYIALDPKIRFGRPIIKSKGIETAIIRERIDAGEDEAFIANDYDISIKEVSIALAYEMALETLKRKRAA